MKTGRKLMAGVFGAGLLMGGIMAQAARQHPNLEAAQNLIDQAFQRVVTAQKDDHYDMQGHAERAKQLLQQAKGELNQAIAADSRNHK
jgi:hypothetical protein